MNLAVSIWFALIAWWLHLLSPQCLAISTWSEPAHVVEESAVARLRQLEQNCSEQGIGSAKIDLIDPIALRGGVRTHCPAAFDGFACWPRTPAGHVARQPCPEGAFRPGGDGSAWRECMQDGHWRYVRVPIDELAAAGRFNSSESSSSSSISFNVELINDVFTNYSECQKMDGFDDLVQDLRVTSVSKTNQKTRWALDKIACEHLARTPGNASVTTSRTCAPTFDGVLCWPRAPAGSRVFKSCPDYINELNRWGLAWRVCLANGSWHPPLTTKSGGEGWTNFSDCDVQKVASTGTDRRRVLQIILIVGHIGYGISLVFLLLAVAILAAFRRLHCQKNVIHINLFVAFAMRAASHFFNYLVMMDSVLIVCRFQQSLMTYTVMTSFTWVFVEALHLFMLIFVNTMSNSNLPAAAYMAIGWGAPWIFTGVWIALRLFLDNRECWRKYRPMGPDIWLINLYLCLLVFINVVLFAIIVRELFVKLKTQPRTSEASQNYRKLWKSTSVLVVVFGIYYLIFLPLSMIPKDKLGDTLTYVKLAYEHFFSSFQGFFVSLLFCFVNSDVHKELKRGLLETKLGRWMTQRGILKPLEDVYGLEPENRRRVDRRSRAARKVDNGIDEGQPLRFQYTTA